MLFSELRRTKSSQFRVILGLFHLRDLISALFLVCILCFCFRSSWLLLLLPLFVVNSAARMLCPCLADILHLFVAPHLRPLSAIAEDCHTVQVCSQHTAARTPHRSPFSALCGAHAAVCRCCQFCLPVKKGFIWVETIPSGMVCEIH